MSKSKSSGIRSTGAVISKRDPLWAIAAMLPVEALQWCKQQLLEDLREEDLEVVSGKDGFTAMLAFAEASDIGDAIALELAAKHEAVTYLLDFDDEAESTREYHVRVQRQRGHPVAFLKTRGISPRSRRAEPSTPRDPDPDAAAIADMFRAFAKELETKYDLQPEDPMHITEDLQWVIAAAVPTEDLQWCQHRLPWMLRDQGSQLIAGTRDFSALLGYGGANDLWMSAAVRFSELFKISTYLLELGGDECSIKKLDVRVGRKKVPPAEFLATHGIEVFAVDT
jgi:hypothetical protein